jgi:hypothetical protein
MCSISTELGKPKAAVSTAKQLTYIERQSALAAFWCTFLFYNQFQHETEKPMVNTIDFRVELLVTRAELENKLFGHDSEFADLLTLSLDVESNITPENQRNVSGEKTLYGSFNYNSSDYIHDYYGSWAFHTDKRFSASIQFAPEQIQRLWQVCSSRPQWLFVCIEEGPPVPKLDTRAC